MFPDETIQWSTAVESQASLRFAEIEHLAGHAAIWFENASSSNVPLSPCIHRFLPLTRQPIYTLLGCPKLAVHYTVLDHLGARGVAIADGSVGIRGVSHTSPMTPETGGCTVLGCLP